MLLSDKILDFLFNLRFHSPLPGGFEVLAPFTDPATIEAATTFYHKYYSDSRPRYCIIGINPGRFGAGITGVPFTDPIRLESKLGIENDWPKKQELSSVFIYDMIEAYGGPEAFYHEFYVTAVSPLGLVKNGKNINYYDDKEVQAVVTPYAVKWLHSQLAWGLHGTTAFCLGEGKNYKFLRQLNEQHSFFEQVVPLSHPRFIMQYKLKQKVEYIQHYLDAFAAHTSR